MARPRRTLTVPGATYDLLQAIAKHEEVPVTEAVKRAAEEYATRLLQASITPGIAAAFPPPEPLKSILERGHHGKQKDNPQKPARS